MMTDLFVAQADRESAISSIFIGSKRIPTSFVNKRKTFLFLLETRYLKINKNCIIFFIFSPLKKIKTNFPSVVV